MIFDDANAQPDQTFELNEDHDGSLEYRPKLARFLNVEHHSIYFPHNFGAETSKVYFIGLKGDFQEAHRHGVTICTYEAKPNISDHKTDTFDSVHHPVS